MKTYKNLYEKIISEDNLRLAFKKAAKGKTKRKDIARILNDLDYHVEKLHGILEREEFRPSKHAKQQINDGFKQKKRYIIKPYYRYEQVVHHAIIQVLAPTDEAIRNDPTLHKVINRGAYEFSCGSVKGRGAHYGKKHMEKWIREDHKGTKYVMKIDVRHFFESIPHDRLKAKLRRVIADEKTLRLLDLIIDAVDEGLPLGYYTSQWLANFYLQDLDHYIKQEIWLPEKQAKEEAFRKRMARKGITDYQMPKYPCGIKKLERYMDDIVGLHGNKRELQTAMKRICEYCKDKLGLIIKENKQVFLLAKEYVVQQIDTATGKVKEVKREIGRALDFMGFLFRRTRTTIRKAILYRITRKARRIGKKEKVNWYDASSMISSMGYFKHTDTYNTYVDWVKPYINIKTLKKKVSNHGRKEGGKIAA
jgi:hypothetical protein